MARKKSKKLNSLLDLIRERNEEQDLFRPKTDIDPRSIILDPETTDRETYERHQQLCDDLNLLEDLLPPEDDEDYPF